MKRMQAESERKQCLGGNSLYLFFTILLCQRFQGNFNTCRVFLFLEGDVETLVSSDNVFQYRWAPCVFVKASIWSCGGAGTHVIYWWWIVCSPADVALLRVPAQHTVPSNSLHMEDLVVELSRPRTWEEILSDTHAEGNQSLLYPSSRAGAGNPNLNDVAAGTDGWSCLRLKT